MKTISSITRSAAIASAIIAASVAVNAATVTITNTAPDWSSVVGGSGINEGWGAGGTSNNWYNVRWGTPAQWGGDKSGLGFNPANPPSGTHNTDVAFVLGQLRHYNNPIYNAASQVDLSLTSTITDASPASQTFAYRFLIDETTNTSPCAYPSTTPCADRISFQNLDLNSSFQIGGIFYTIELLGFGSSADSLSTSFISNEGGTNTTNLWARVTTVPSQVPEPASLALVGLALAAAGVAGKKRRVTS